jgi:putative alpha-1,2-mannosidase
MSAWFVFSALGFYPQAGTTNYFLGSPIFDDVTVSLPTGTLQIATYNNSDTNMYLLWAIELLTR